MTMQLKTLNSKSLNITTTGCQQSSEQQIIKTSVDVQDITQERIMKSMLHTLHLRIAI